MDLTSRPLLATKRDQQLFAGREWELEEISRDLRRGFNLIVEGESGSGKTTLLRALMWAHHTAEQRNAGARIYVRAAGLASAAAVLNRVLDVLAERETSPEQLLNAGAALRELAEIHRSLSGVCVLLDDVDPRVGNQLFGVLRDELWETRVQWVVAVRSSDVATLRMPPADAFFETTMLLSALSSNEALELLSRRMAYTKVGDELEGTSRDRIRLLAGKGGQPRELLERARHVDENNDPASVLAASEEIRRVLASLGRPANMLYAEIRHRDPISASDPDVQALMGWTRPRLIQVLGELEQAGLVESFDQSQKGPGRPKKMFRVLSPFERRSLSSVEEA